MTSFIPEKCLSCPVVADHLNSIQSDGYFADQAILAGIYATPEDAARMIDNEHVAVHGFTDPDAAVAHMQRTSGEIFAELEESIANTKEEVTRLTMFCSGHMGGIALDGAGVDPGECVSSFK